MDVFALVAAFGGGAFGATIGALPAFILTGAIAIAGAAAQMAGGSDFIVGNVAFGSFLGPHIAFAGGVAAAAYAANMRSANKLKATTTDEVEQETIEGTSIGLSLHLTQDYRVLLVGGVFGILGFLINHLYANVIGFQTDTVAMTVATSGILARFMLGRTGLIGKCCKDNKLCKSCGKCNRQFFSLGKGLMYNLVLGGTISILVSFVAASLMNTVGISNEIMVTFPTLCFGISALSLIFAQTGSATPGTHHITLIAALATIASGNPLVGVSFGVVSTLIGDFAVNTFNSQCDSHIDPPAIAIFICTFIINALF